MKRNNKRSINRKNSIRKAKHKRYIAEKIYNFENGWYNNLHAYSKNKVFCSCECCSGQSKTNPKGHWSAGKRNWSTADRKKWESMNEQEKDFQKTYSAAA